MAKRRTKRKKNLSTGAWVAISIGIGIGVPALVVGVVTLYGIKKGKEIVDDFGGNLPGYEYGSGSRPIPTPTPPPINY